MWRYLRLVLLAWIAIPLQCAWGQEGSGTAKWGIEATGGTVGSLTGVALGVLTNDCDPEDLSCILRQLSFTGISSMAGASAGVYLSGRLGDTRPSMPGTLVGAGIGLAAGAGLVKLLDEVGVAESVTAIAAYSITQGVIAALGSRILAAH